MTTELHPHVVFPKDGSEPEIECADYRGAYIVWRSKHHWKAPWLIRTVATGRVIDPDEAITGPGE